ncbi:H-NS histone family protein [Noviherbaspirillum pedocola]|uniref:H-NS histone family protein n=1 Tax=Noviherbaspirillum pedocola TaxID=2801341 RepID=A0A934W6F2_9BURK|nr:H-NS histone family protein [Noviherbaspirillum pedocola]MBK4736152.1 H-NS histone family protein [Noviherbaspirillum pedocola]
MASYKEIQEKIAELQRQAEEQRRAEIDGAIGQIKSLMSDYGISIDDLEDKKKKGAKKSSGDVKFRDDQGNTWSGRGRKPAWIQGKDADQFRV